ncbi:hypothetical protein WJX81_003429 [Elliptochloris bilobata]|uniref:Peptidase A1 domain-containing protein n=1 Tax=Elliptochloris bilobata TaxID=381761 RepID=A0AAW1SBZ2_9CHLO
MPLHGAVKDYGYFYATLLLGTPQRQFAVIVDTGSTITYVPCASCGKNCGPHHKDLAFDPASSTTSQLVPCGSEKCLCGRPACGCSDKHECTYQRTYAEQSSSAGLLVADQLQVGNGSVEVVFGCETKETGEIYNQEADGILGLGNSEVSLVNQLASNGNIDDVFALCFGSVEGDGALMLGDADVAGRFNVALQYTPLLANPAHPHYYSVALEALVVGGDKLDVKPATYEVGYGTVLDSGTTFTYLPSDAFVSFREAVTRFALAHGLHVTKGPDPKFPDVCFGGGPHADRGAALAADMEHVFPVLELQFAQNTHLRTGPLNYLFMHTGEAGAYCLGVFDNGAAGTLLGGISFRNVLRECGRRRGARIHRADRPSLPSKSRCKEPSLSDQASRSQAGALTAAAAAHPGRMVVLAFAGVALVALLAGAAATQVASCSTPAKEGEAALLEPKEPPRKAGWQTHTLVGRIGTPGTLQRRLYRQLVWFCPPTLAKLLHGQGVQQPPPWLRYDITAGAIRAGLAGAAAALVCVALASGLAGAPARNTPEVAELIQQQDSGSGLALALASLVLAPAVEELLFRGFLLPCLAARMPLPAAVLLSGGAFAGSHLAPPQDAALLLVLGCTLGCVAAASGGSLAAVTLAHALYNAAVLAGALL